MRRAELDAFLLSILDETPSASDINFTVGKPLQVEVDGLLKPACTDLGINALTPFHTETMALNLVGKTAGESSTSSTRDRATFPTTSPAGRGFASIYFLSAAPTRSPCGSFQPRYRRWTNWNCPGAKKDSR